MGCFAEDNCPVVDGEKRVSMEITVRELRDSDIEELARIEEESFSMPWSAEAFQDLLSHSYCTYLVALADGQVAGCCGYTVVCGEANIDNVVVDPALRCCGIAQAMLHELILRGRVSGVGAFTLEVRISNQIALHIYEKLGFRSEGIRPNFYEKPIEDANIMWLR